MSVLLLLMCVVVIIAVIYWAMRKEKDFDKIPGPSGIIFLDNSLDFLMDPVQLFRYIRELCNRYTGLFKLKYGHVKVVVVHHPVNVEAVLSTTKYNKKGFIYEFIEPWLKEGLIMTAGSKWSERRKLLAPAFHFNVLNSFKFVIEENCSKFVEKLQAEVKEEKTHITPYVDDFAINSICETTMGIKLDEVATSVRKEYRDAIYQFGQCAVYRAQRLWMYPNFIFKFTTVGKKQNQILQTLASFRNEVIEKRKILSNDSYDNFTNDCRDNDKDINIFTEKKMVLLDLLLKAEKDGIIDMKGIGEEVDTFMFAGHDTSGNVLQFTLMLLANYQDIQKKVVEECNDIFGSSNRSATMANLAQMKYLECCIKETMRLYPPVPSITRKIEHPLKLDNYEIPIGTECFIPIFDLHRRSDQFDEPLLFRPERFLTVPTWHPYAYIPFSAGPRICIGLKFAMMELKLAVSAVLRRYRLLAITKPDDIIFITDYVIRAKDPIYIKIEERN